MASKFVQEVKVPTIPVTGQVEEYTESYASQYALLATTSFQKKLGEKNKTQTQHKNLCFYVEFAQHEGCHKSCFTSLTWVLLDGLIFQKEELKTRNVPFLTAVGEIYPSSSQIW